MPRPARKAALWLMWSMLGLTGVEASTVAAQEAGTAGPKWQLEGLKRSFCVAFLIDPAPAAKQLPKKFRPVPAARFSLVHPALRALIEDEAQYQSWIPSILCAFGASAVVIDGRRLGRSEPGQREMIGIWGIAGTPEEDEADSLWVVREFLTANDRIKRAAEVSLLRLRVIDEQVGEDPEAGEDLLGLKIGKTRLTWVGHLGGDSIGVAEPRHEVWWLKGNRGTTWHARVSQRPKWHQSMVGGLRVEGKDDLAKALKASPIRMLGPAFWGGSGEVSFERR